MFEKCEFLVKILNAVTFLYELVVCKLSVRDGVSLSLVTLSGEISLMVSVSF